MKTKKIFRNQFYQKKPITCDKIEITSEKKGEIKNQTILFDAAFDFVIEESNKNWRKQNEKFNEEMNVKRDANQQYQEMSIFQSVSSSRENVRRANGSLRKQFLNCK